MKKNKALCMIKILLLSGVLISSNTTHAEVMVTEESYFDIKIVTTLNSSPKKASKQLLNISQWWQSSHTYSGDSRNLLIDLKSQHCFCEKLAEGGFVRHMTVAYFEPEKKLRLIGGLGPLQALPINGVLEFSLARLNNNQTELITTYKVSGTGVKLKSWASAVNKVITEQVTSFKQQVEK
ncbi:hypothetical protein [Aliikangiella sp. IMCC44359]|uniref:hypothetical protein n=1 Tax=Aliikangiella sp. IMCC44359 TaxID=3459125 RepID=UPI00403B1102